MLAQLDAQVTRPYGAGASQRNRPMTEAIRAAAPSQGAGLFAARKTGILVLADGTAFEGQAFGAETHAVGEVCFNTAMTGYQEILADPSYAGQIIAFTFPHIGIVGANEEDIESITPAVRGLVVRAHAESPSNYRASLTLDRWLKRHNFPGLEGLDLAKEVSCRQMFTWNQTPWQWHRGYGRQENPSWRAVVVDFGVKRNILRLLAGSGAEIIVLPAASTTEDVMRHSPHGVLLSNGPGDPAATGEYAIPMIRGLIDAEVPVFGICLGHQMLGLALGGQTRKMAQGHHGANHPVKDLETGKVEIVSMNHGFTVDRESLPSGIKETHVSLFDGTNCGIRVENRAIFSVQYHPEASPGPMDSHYLFERFAAAAKT